MVKLAWAFYKAYEVEKVNKFERNIKIALIITIVLLMTFIGFSRFEILFSNKDNLIINVSTPKNLLKPSRYVASLISVTENSENSTTTTEEKKEVVTTTKKQEIEAVPNNNIVDVVPAAVEPSYGGQSLSEIAARLNSKFKGSLSNMGELLARLCIEKGMDPYLLAAISVHETGNGLSSAALYKFNYGGIMCSGSLCSYGSAEEGITKFVDVVYYGYFSKGLVTPEQMNSKYAASTTWATQVNNHYNNLKNN